MSSARVDAAGEPRVAWVDTAKGICIIFVVMMHSTLGVGLAAGEDGFLHRVVEFARPFRMPDFFLISGLFLGLVIDRPLRRYVDRKVVHFFYFYLLWLVIQFAFKAPGMAMEEGIAGAGGQFLLGLVQPFGTLWFIYVLPVFFLFTRLVKTLPVWLVFAWAAFLEMVPVHTGSVLFDEFCARYVFFFAGYAFARHIFDIADWLAERPFAAIVVLAIWAPLNGLFVFTPVPDALAFLLQPEMGTTGQTGGVSELPGVALLLGFAGALAVVSVAALVTRLAGATWPGRALSWLGAHSIVVYLAFFLPMAVSRAVLLKTGIITDIGWISVLVTIAGVVAPVILYGLIQWSGYGRWLFERPRWASIDRPARQKASALDMQNS